MKSQLQSVIFCQTVRLILEKSLNGNQSPTLASVNSLLVSNPVMRPSGALVLFLCFSVSSALNNGLARKPPMGWRFKTLHLTTVSTERLITPLDFKPGLGRHFMETSISKRCMICRHHVRKIILFFLYISIDDPNNACAGGSFSWHQSRRARFL